MKTYEIWHKMEDGALTESTCIPADSSNKDLPWFLEGHVLVHTFEAETWNAAMQINYDFHGYGTYYPPEGTKDI